MGISTTSKINTFQIKSFAAFTQFSRPGAKPDVYENGFPSLKTQISCLQF